MSTATFPLVTAVMVTGKYPQRYALARNAVTAFLQQTWPSKKLVIINDGQEPVGDAPVKKRIEASGAKVVEYMLSKGKSLGELRNLGLQKAGGDYVVQWDDDDWYHPQRIAVQMQCLRSNQQAEACLLKWQVRYSFTHDCAIAWRWNYPLLPGIPGTVLHRQREGITYRSEARAEDTHFLQDHFQGRICVYNNRPEDAQGPELYLRFFHGDTNTWDEGHILGEASRLPHNWRLDESTSDYLRQILTQHYASWLVPD